MMEDRYVYFRRSSYENNIEGYIVQIRITVANDIGKHNIVYSRAQSSNTEVNIIILYLIYKQNGCSACNHL